MLICNRCGKRKRESEIQEYMYEHGEIRGDYSCRCGGEFIGAKQCKYCGSWFDNTELFGVCEKCLEEYETVGDALKFGDDRREKVAINGFVADALSEEKINEILTKYVEENFTDHSKPVIDYCEYDKYDFSEFVADKVG